METKLNIDAPNGKLGVLIIGLNGAVATTFVAGTLAAGRNLAKPIGSLTQMGRIRVGKREDNNFPLIKEFLPLAKIEDIVFGGWDARYSNTYDAAIDAAVLKESDLAPVRGIMSEIEPMKAVFEQKYVKNIEADWVKDSANKYQLYLDLVSDIREFKKKNNADRLVMIWCASTEAYIKANGVHDTLNHFESALKDNHPDISPSMIYAFAAISEGVPFINGSPSLSCDIEALNNLAKEKNVPIAGKDFKTGQTLMKTVLAPMLKTKMLGLNGWFSTNILGNRDGAVLDDPDSFKTKETSKLSVLDGILQPELYPELYADYYHKVRIDYYPPRGDNKEGWDNIDIFGWMGYPMQLKVNFLCRDSILAAPLALDLSLLMDLASRANMGGIQDWLSFFFKSPIHDIDKTPEHDLFIQSMKMKNNMRKMVGAEQITHAEYL
jgi:myo-inositol-1-phosphate synthase